VPTMRRRLRPFKRMGRGPRKPRRDLVVELEPDGECLLCDQRTEITIKNRINGNFIQLCVSCCGTIGVSLPVPGGLVGEDGTN
jgi:hypothetical protein